MPEATPKLSTHYGGADLALEYESGTHHIRLVINGVVREEANGAAGTTLKVTSTVQTDYEWHEFIEGTASTENGNTTLTLVANGQVIATTYL